MATRLTSHPVIRCILACALPLLIFILPTLATPDNIITVCPVGCDYNAIQPAIDAAQAGDTIVVAAGLYTGQLTLKSNLTLTAQGGPTSTIITALASPIVSGSNLDAVTLEGFGITGHPAITAPIGIDLVDSSVAVSNVIVSDLHGANGTLVYTDGLNAIGLRLSGTSSVTVSNSIFENITGGDAEVDSVGRGGDGIGLSATGDGRLTIISSTVRNLVGGAAGKYAWAGYITGCDGHGGRSLGIDKEGIINLSVEQTHIKDLVGGQPCTGSYGPGCRNNAGEVIGIRAVSGTLHVNTSAVTDLHGYRSYPETPNSAISTSFAHIVSVENTEIAALSAVDNDLAANQPTSPYCAPRPSSSIGIASTHDESVSIGNNDLHDLTGVDTNGYSRGVWTHASQTVTLTRNRIQRLSGGDRYVYFQDVLPYQALGVKIDSAQQTVIADNQIDHLRGGNGFSGYVYSTSGGGVAGIEIEATAQAQLTNNLIFALAGGHGIEGDIWAEPSNGGDATGLHLFGGYQQAQNNTIYDLRGGQSGRPDWPAGQGIGFAVEQAIEAYLVNNAIISTTIGISSHRQHIPMGLQRAVA